MAKPKPAKAIHTPPTRKPRRGWYEEKLRTIVAGGKFGETYEINRFRNYRGAVSAASRLRRGVHKVPPGVKWEWSAGEDPKTNEGVLYATMR